MATKVESKKIVFDLRVVAARLKDSLAMLGGNLASMNAECALAVARYAKDFMAHQRQ
ncbi:hypothetical protein [Rhizobium tubonense]|uniref:hypothetical protein n=1 Tax=Rhizobium tubonense TaxID=484088 RepID=UPI0012B6A5CB|nr:hypothetical protein [Rhizobium tubonense]